MRFSLYIFFLFLLPSISYSQAGEGTATVRPLNDNGFSIGIYGGPNNTWGKNVWANQTSSAENSAEWIPEKGYDYSLNVRWRLKEGAFFCTGLSYGMQSYKINNNDAYFDNPAGYFLTNSIDYSFHYIFTYNNYYISIPLVTGYAFTKKKWEFFTGLGMEFYYNLQNTETVNDELTGQSKQVSFFKGHSGIIYNGVFDFYWAKWSAFGELNAGASYKLSRKLSVSLMPVMRFTDPFANTPYWETVAHNAFQGILSLNTGLIYHFSDRYVMGESSEKWEKNSLGFNIIPTYLLNKITIPPPNSSYSFFYPKINWRYTYSYAIALQYDFTDRIKLETGIAIDNFDYDGWTTNTLIGLPLVGKYYIPLGKAQNSSIYLGGGVHIDYPTNIGWLYVPAHPFVLPLAIVKCGYRFNFGSNYFFETSLGIEHQFPNIQSSRGNINPDIAEVDIVNLPNYLFCTVGVGYKL